MGLYTAEDRMNFNLLAENLIDDIDIIFSQCQKIIEKTRADSTLTALDIVELEDKVQKVYTFFKQTIIHGEEILLSIEEQDKAVQAYWLIADVLNAIKKLF